MRGDAVHDRQVQPLDHRAVAQREHAAVEELVRLLLGEGGVVVDLAEVALASCRAGCPRARAPARAPPRRSRRSPSSICVSRSMTLISSSAWCAVSARPDSEITCGIGTSFSRHASASE
jgi:hypothetical protein